jgi:NDP-sugar pyrophosphorylase family protein
MNAMILAAGRGTRLGAVGKLTPKVLVEVNGEPLLSHQIRYLKSCGVDRIVLNAHHLADQITSFVSALPRSLDVKVIYEPNLLGTAGGVVNALPCIGEETFVVLYGDVIIEESLHAVYATHQQMEASTTVTVYRSTNVEGKGTVDMTAHGEVTAFREKADTKRRDHSYINAGLYILEPDTLNNLPTGVLLDFGHDVFPSLLAEGRTIAAHVLAAPVLDIGTPDALQLAQRV